MIKADFLCYGTIGFQKMWLDRYGLVQEKLLEDIARQGIKAGLGILAITTEDDKIIKSYPEDRFGFLKEQVSSLRSKGYFADIIGDNIIRVRDEIEGGKIINIINSQVVHTKQIGRLVKHLVLGSNEIPQGMCLEKTVNYCAERKLPQFLMDVYEESKYDPELRLFKSVAGKCDGVVSHSATHSLSPGIADALKLIPKIEQLAKYTSYANKFADAFAGGQNRPGIAVSRAHFIDSIGQAYMELPAIFDHIFKRTNSEREFFNGIKSAIASWNSSWHRGFDSPGKTLKYAVQLQLHGGKPDRFKDERSSYNTQ